MTEQTQATSPGFWRFLRGLLRLLLFAVIVAIITGAIFLAMPYAYRYLLLPVQNNRLVIDHVQRTQTQLQKDVIQQTADQQQRLAQLEAALAAEREIRSELESRLADQAESVTAQATAQAGLLENMTQQSQSLAGLAATLRTLDESVTGMEQVLSAPDSEFSRLRQQTLLLQMGQTLFIARLHLVENNAGQAQAVLGEAGQTLNQLAEMAGPQAEAVTELQTQLERAKTAIEERPFTALQELDILVQLLQAFPQS